MTKEQTIIIHELRTKLFRSGYPPIFIVSLAELEAVEDYSREWLIEHKYPPILACGKNGLYFKGCELVLEVKE